MKEPITLVILPGLDGSEILFRPLSLRAEAGATLGAKLLNDNYRRMGSCLEGRVGQRLPCFRRQLCRAEFTKPLLATRASRR